jgi:hypothetical protein
MLCSGGSKSIAAKSLAHDRCAEPCIFRIVTRADINPDLRPLRWARDNSGRWLNNDLTLALHQAVCSALGEAHSPRGRSASHWLADTVWDVMESEQAVTHRNQWELQVYLEREGEPLFTDQLREVYERLLFRVQQAALPKWEDGPDKKKLLRSALRDWLLNIVQRVKGYAPSKAGTSLHQKMTAASIPTEAIDNADHLRREYRSRMLDPKYQQEQEVRTADLQVVATLQQLLSALDAGSFQDDGVQFHARCLSALPSISAAYPRAELSYLQGAVYAITDRCRHRFIRALS